MKLTPLDLRKQQFKKTFRGYDPDEVRGFIEKLALDWEEALEEKRRAEERVTQYEDKLRHYEKVELALQEALETARETGRRAEDAAHQRAKLIVEEAELRAQRIVQDAEQERYNMRQDLVKLTSRQNEIAARLRAFLMSEMEVLAQFQGDDPIGFIKLVSASEHSAQEALPTADRARLGPAPAQDRAPSAREATPTEAPPAPTLPFEPTETAQAPEAEADRAHTPPPLEATPADPAPDSAPAPVADPPATAAPAVATARAPEPSEAYASANETGEAAPAPPADAAPADAAPAETAPSEPEPAPAAAPPPVPVAEALAAPPEPAQTAPAPPWVKEEEQKEGRTPTYRDWLSVLSARRSESRRSEPPAAPQPEPAGSPEAASGAPFDRNFFQPPVPDAPPEPAPTSDAARGWSLRSIVTGDREERAEGVAASKDERERIRRILEDLD
ncbi:MAG: DivIVA domain-containing protein [Rubricoccaceae bacterium]|nr:DivIVA domain-containing protein [Rubricoccaceae bacterium]